ncbi:MAG: hypothetical protein HN576_04520 [Bacteriovoracaceae bacterium]|jgi:2-(1,2-epoxy-1,2-dihydrophenyl)acetyl-CoA isomerase|nr:hypothetical protein [Bacteriovoracaceae bacterium]
MSDFEYLKLTTDKQVRLITINRPEVYNSLNKDAKAEIVNAIKEANNEAGIRCIILTGSGKAFSAGQDLNDRNVQATQRAVDLGNTLKTEWNPLVNAIRNSEKVVIAAINGVAAGAGLSVAMAADMITCHPKAKFISGFSKLGLTPDAGSSFIFERALGYKKSLEFFLFNEPLQGAQMEEYGLVNYVNENYLEKAFEWAHNISEMAPHSVNYIKSNLRDAMDSSYAESMENETKAQKFLGNSMDYKEGLSAFFDKRPPQFQGH